MPEILEGNIKCTDLIFHHNKSLCHSDFSIARPSPKYKAFDLEANLWLERQLGFYPLYLAVGDTENDISITGYQNQWRRLLSEYPKQYRPKGDTENRVLFSYRDVPGGVFMDYYYWIYVLNSSNRGYKIPQRIVSNLFRPKWSRQDWIDYSKTSYVQMTVPLLDLTAADLVSVRNKKTRQYLKNLGFINVQVQRLPI